MVIFHCKMLVHQRVPSIPHDQISNGVHHNQVLIGAGHQCQPRWSRKETHGSHAGKNLWSTAVVPLVSGGTSSEIPVPLEVQKYKLGFGFSHGKHPVKLLDLKILSSQTPNYNPLAAALQEALEASGEPSKSSKVWEEGKHSCGIYRNMINHFFTSLSKIYKILLFYLFGGCDLPRRIIYHPTLGETVLVAPKANHWISLVPESAVGLHPHCFLAARPSPWNI